jgi:hypothetical protein
MRLAGRAAAANRHPLDLQPVQGMSEQDGYKQQPEVWLGLAWYSGVFTAATCRAPTPTALSSSQHPRFMCVLGVCLPACAPPHPG